MDLASRCGFGLPRDFYLKLLDEPDWGFVIKLHSLFEAAATHILSFEDEGEVVFFEGNFTAYEEMKKAKGGDLTPHRPRFKNMITA